MEPYLLLGVLLSAVAAGVGAVTLTVLGGRAELGPGEGGRRAVLRTRSFAYRWCEPTVDAVAGLYRRHAAATVNRLQHHLEVLDETAWRADELLATKQVEAVLLGAVAACGAAAAFSPAAAVVLAAAAVLLFPLLEAQSYKAKAEKRVGEVRGRLPFAMDLMALLLEAGAGTLRECLERVGEEHRGQPLGEEVRRTLFGVEKGANTADMLRTMDRRLTDPDVKEVVQSITTSEERGISLKDALRGLADRMRQRKVQWMEKSAEQAKVKITGPAMVTMVACLLIVVSPLVLQVFDKSGRGVDPGVRPVPSTARR